MAHLLIPILLYADDIVLLSGTPEGLQRHLDVLHHYCTTWGLSVNLAKTKVMVFNTNRQSLHNHTFTYDGQPIDIVTSYTYLGVLFTSPRLGFRQAALARARTGHRALVQMERGCTAHHIHDPRTRCHLFDTLVTPAVMYASEIWLPGLAARDCACISRIQANMLGRMIRAKPSTPHDILCVEFASPPILLDAYFRIVLLLRHLHDIHSSNPDRYSAAALASSRDLAASHATVSWYQQMVDLLQHLHISPADLPRGTHRQIRREIFRRYIQCTWHSLSLLRTRQCYYREHFLSLGSDGLPVLPLYLSQPMSHALRYRQGQLRISSHPLAIETGRSCDIPRHHRLCRLCSLQEVEDEYHFLLRCPVYYEIRGRYHCLFRDGPHTLRTFLAYPDARCLGLLLREMFSLRTSLLPPSDDMGLDHKQLLLTRFFQTRAREEDSDDDIDIPVRPQKKHRPAVSSAISSVQHTLHAFLA